MTTLRAIQTTEDRLAALLELRNRINREIRRARAGSKKRRRKPSDPALPRRSRYEIPECGTETAYQRHRWYGEEKDEACKEAHRQHNRELDAQRRKGVA